MSRRQKYGPHIPTLRPRICERTFKIFASFPSRFFEGFNDGNKTETVGRFETLKITEIRRHKSGDHNLK
jgi:hypothetical protein